MANTGLDRAIAPVVSSYLSLAIAFVVIAALSALIATQFGGRTRQQRRATFSLVSVICFLVYMTMIFPRILGAGTPHPELVPTTRVEATHGVASNAISPESPPIVVATPTPASADDTYDRAKEVRCNDQYQRALAAIPGSASLADAGRANDRIQQRYSSCVSNRR